MLDHKTRIMAAFVLHATSVGGLYVRLPEIQSALGISEGTYGLVLMGTPLGVLTGSLMVPRLMERMGGPRVIITLGLMGAALCQIAAALAGGPWLLALALVAFGFAFAGANVSINVEASRYEATHGTSMISRCHGWWALGFLAMSFAAAGLIRFGLVPVWQFTIHAALMAPLAALIVLPMPQSQAAPEAGQKSRRFALPGRGVLLIGAWALAGILMEGTTRGWIVIYVREALGASVEVAAFALPAIVLTQTLLRFAGDGLIMRFGVVRVARASSLCLGLGVAALVLAPNVPVAILGCLIVGLGIAINMPQGFAAAGRLRDRPSAESVAGFASLSTIIGFIGPPLFGLLAETVSLRVAFALALPLTVLSFAMAWRLAPDAAESDGKAPA